GSGAAARSGLAAGGDRAAQPRHAARSGCGAAAFRTAARVRARTAGAAALPSAGVGAARARVGRTGRAPASTGEGDVLPVDVEDAGATYDHDDREPGREASSEVVVASHGSGS